MSLLHFFPQKDIEVVSARNATVTTADGRDLLDAGGLSHGAAIVGHNHPDVVAAVQGQAARLTQAAHLYPNPARTAFLAALHTHLPDTLSRTFLCNSGTEAVEACLKFAAGATGRSRFVALEGGFHGRTLGALAVTHKPGYRDPVAGILAPTTFVQRDDADLLRSAITEETAAVILEPVQGEGGVHPLDPDFLRAARERCDETGTILVFDEVQTGMGRTGPFLASTASGVVPDLLALGKGLAGGLPAGAAVARQDVADRLPAGFHGSTYGGGPLVAAAGAAALGVWDREALGARSATLGDRFRVRLESIGHPAIDEVRGRGLMVNVDLRGRPGPVLQALHEADVLALAGGARGLRFLPPLTIDEADLDRTADALAAVLGALHG